MKWERWLLNTRRHTQQSTQQHNIVSKHDIKRAGYMCVTYWVHEEVDSLHQTTWAVFPACNAASLMSLLVASRTCLLLNLHTHHTIVYHFTSSHVAIHSKYAHVNRAEVHGYSRQNLPIVQLYLPCKHHTWCMYSILTSHSISNSASVLSIDKLPVVHMYLAIVQA